MANVDLNKSKNDWDKPRLEICIPQLAKERMSWSEVWRIKRSDDCLAVCCLSWLMHLMFCEIFKKRVVPHEFRIHPCMQWIVQVVVWQVLMLNAVEDGIEVDLTTNSGVSA